MANGSTHRGPAKRDMILEQGGKHDRYLQRMIDEERARGELPSYNDDATSEITANGQGVVARLGLPRLARQAIGISIAVLIGALGVAAAIVAVLRFWPR
jgi:hypothetical protein